MVSKLAIVTDSTCGIPPEELKKLGVEMVPLNIIFGDEEYRDGVDLTEKEFFAKLRTSDALPTTSQPSIGAFQEVYERLSTEYDRAISIHISGGISGTVQAAKSAADLVAPFPVDVVDSEYAAILTGFMVLEAQQMASEGKSREEILERIEFIKEQLRVYFIVDDLNHLYRGGRLTKVQLVVGNMLQIKPILTIKHTISPYQKVRTMKKAKAMIMDLFRESAATGRPIKASVVHADALEEARQWLGEIEAEFPEADVSITTISPVIAAHTGPGTLALVWYIVE